jgi:hypothetical protein
MSGKGRGWYGIRFAIRERIIDKNRPFSDLVELVRDYKPDELTEMAQRIYHQLDARDKALTDKHTEAAVGFLNLYFDIGEENLRDHAKKPARFRARFRNHLLAAARKNWCKREHDNGTNRPIPDGWKFEAVPEELVPEDANVKEAPRGQFQWLPEDGEEFTRAGELTVGPNKDRLVFEVDRLFAPELVALCSEKQQPGLYMFVLESGDTKEVLKIGMFGNGVQSSAWSTIGDYCGRFPTDCTPKWSSRLGPAMDIAKTLTNADIADEPAKCSWYICMMPNAVLDRKLNIPGDVRVAARSFEDGCVTAYTKAHGRPPRYNLLEGGQRGEVFLRGPVGS